MTDRESDKQVIELKGSFDLHSVIGFLEDLTESLKKENSVYVQKGDAYVTLKPATEIEVEVKASQKEDKEKFAFSMSWKRVVPKETEKLTMTVSASEPKIEPKPEKKEEAPEASGNNHHPEKEKPAAKKSTAGKSTKLKSTTKKKTKA